jgi:hypothetical protein
MPATSHVELAVALLRDAAGFFRNVGEQNRSFKSEMFDNADVYDRVADLLDEDPTGLVELEED